MSKRQGLFVALLFFVYALVVWLLCWISLRGNPLFIPIGGVLTVCGLTLVGVYWLLSRQAAGNSAAERPPVQSTPAASLSADNSDLQAVEALLSEAQTKLAQSPLLASARVRPRLSDLPLFVLTGPEGAGKTTVFLQAGLEAEPLAGQIQAGSRIVPTQIANFWFAKQALIVEASGRLFSGEAGRWAAFLNALKGKSSRPLAAKVWTGGRTAQNLRGVILLLDCNYFAGVPDASRLTNLGRICQEKLRMVSQTFGSDIPVWVVLAKADAIPYFRDYFHRLRPGEEQQPLGCTVELLPANQRPADQLYAENETKRLNESFNSLYYSLTHHRLTFLARETDLSRKGAVYEFPRELKRLRNTLVQFLMDVFRPNALQPGPLLQGFYFTGTRPVPASSKSSLPGLGNETSVINLAEATRLLPKEQVAAVMQRGGFAGGSPAATPAPEPLVERWAFVSQLFHTIMQSGPAAAAYESRRFDVYRRAIFAGLIGICALLGLGFLFSTWNNYAFMKSLDTAASAVQGIAPGEKSFTKENLDALDVLRERLVLLNRYDHRHPWSLDFILYHEDALTGPARKVYFASFQENLLKPVVARLAAELGSLPAEETPAHPWAQTYDNLKTYLSVTNRACAIEPPLGHSLATIWAAGRTTNTDLSKVEAQFSFYLEELGQKRIELTGIYQRDCALRGQAYLKSFGGEQRYYRKLVDEVNHDLGPTVRLADYAPKYTDVLTGIKDLPPAFTHAGWDNMLDRIANAKGDSGESCVLGRSAGDSVVGMLQGPQLSRKLQAMYAQDFIQHWQGLLGDVHVKNFTSTGDASKKLDLLSGNDSPLLGMLFMVSENTAMGISPGAEAKIAEGVKGLASQALDRTRGGAVLKRAASASGIGNQSEDPASPKDVFQPARSLFGPEASRKNWSSPANDPYTRALDSLRKAMARLAEISHPDSDLAANADAKKAVDDGLDTVRELARKFDQTPVNESVKRLLEEPFKAAGGLYVADPGKANAAKMNSGLSELCKKMRPVLAKYPFNGNASDEASPDEATAIFSPQTGAVWSFYSQNLAQVLTKQGHGYAIKADAPPDLKIDPAFLREFNRMTQISDALFADVTPASAMHYTLNILPNPDVRAITLTVDGQRTQGQQRFTWPGNAPRALDLDVQLTGGGTVPMASYAGVWAIFRMMAEADPHPIGARDVSLTKIKHGSGQAKAVTTAEGKDVSVRIRIEEFPGGVENAFDPGFFTCRCPAKVAQ